VDGVVDVEVDVGDGVAAGVLETGCTSTIDCAPESGPLLSAGNIATIMMLAAATPTTATAMATVATTAAGLMPSILAAQTPVNGQMRTFSSSHCVREIKEGCPTKMPRVVEQPVALLHRQ
jgi:hypothetical protein